VSTHYQQEDLPDMGKPEVALDMLQSQLGGLMPIAEIDEGMELARAAMKRLLKLAKDSGVGEVEADVRLAHQALKALHKQVLARESVISGARAALDTEQAARKALVQELEDLKDALVTSDENHPFVGALLSDLYGEIFSDAYSIASEDMTLEDIGYDVSPSLEAMHIKLDGADVLRAIDKAIDDPNFPEDVKAHMLTFLKALEAYEDAKEAAQSAKQAAAWQARQARENGGGQ
jgi:hypothetical protein